MKLERLHFDELKKFKKRNFRQLFRNLTTGQKPVYMPMEFILNKKGMYILLVSSIFLKKFDPKPVGPHCVNE